MCKRSGKGRAQRPERRCRGSEGAGPTQSRGIGGGCAGPGLFAPTGRAAPKVDPRLQRLDLWAGLHGQVPGLRDWDMGNECFLASTTAHLPPAEQNREPAGVRAVGGGGAGQGARCGSVGRAHHSLERGPRP